MRLIRRWGVAGHRIMRWEAALRLVRRHESTRRLVHREAALRSIVNGRGVVARITCVVTRLVSRHSARHGAVMWLADWYGAVWIGRVVWLVGGRLMRQVCVLRRRALVDALVLVSSCAVLLLAGESELVWSAVARALHRTPFAFR